MSANIIYGTDFKRSNPKADRAFWIGPEGQVWESDAFFIVNIVDVPLVLTVPAPPHPRRRRIGEHHDR